MDLDLVSVPGGAFAMGSATGRDDERPVRRVSVRPFEMARTPVTRGQYACFVRATGVATPPWWDAPSFSSDEQPVVGITWDDAVAFCRWHGERFRLPTEAEWERACRGGREDAPTAWGLEVPAGEIPTGRLEGPWAAGRGTPNGYGLYDMGTLVHEWCADWYAPYDASAVEDPRGPEAGERRASRGGSWRHHVRWSSPSARSSLLPHLRYADYGFRVLGET